MSFERNKNLADQSGLPYSEWWELNKHKQVDDVLYPGRKEKREKRQAFFIRVAAGANILLLILLSLQVLKWLL